MSDKKRSKTVIDACVFAGILLAASCSTMVFAASQQTDNQEIAHYIFNQLGYNNVDVLGYIWGPVSAGDTIQTTNEHVFDIPCAGYVMYIDLHPTANLFHQVQYVFFSDENQLTTFDAMSPPQNFKDYQVVDTAYSQFFYSVGNRRAAIPDIPAPEHTGARDNRWAVLMNGGYDQYNNQPRYWNDLSSIYITLNYVYEIPDENIIVLCSDGLNPAPDQANGLNSDPDLDGDGDADIMYACTLANVDMVFTSLAQNFTSTDKLFVFTTDHGSSVSGWSVDENLWNYEVLHDYHFADLLAAFPECEKICTLEPCFSGGFLDNIVVPPGPIVASSACRYDESSWAMSDLVYDEYVFYWTAAITGQDAYGNPVDADANQDGTITMDEAYQFAIAHDTASESPQYGDYPEDIGSYLSLKVSSNPPTVPVVHGPSSGIWNVPYDFTATATDPDGDQVFYMFDWGDGTHSDWIGPYTSGQTGAGSHIWTELGVYAVRAKARDSWGASSPWSTSLNITITDNTPPTPPDITGPSQGKPGGLYGFSFQSSDGQDQNIYYYVDWGDGTNTSWLGPYVNGTMIHLTHAFASQGLYNVSAKAMDILNSESDWATLQFQCPYKFTPLVNLLEWLFARFPNAFPILRQLWGF